MFSGFYKSEYLDRYTCEFDFIPNILPSLWKNGDIDNYIMTNPIEWKKILFKKGVKSDFGIEKIKVIEEEINENKRKFIFIFPEPKVTPECFFALLFIDNEGNSNYFTLELDMSSTLLNIVGGMICGQRRTNHLNYGRRCKSNLDDFQKSVQDIIEGKPYDITEMYKNVDLNEAAKLGFNEEFFKKFGVNKEDVEKQCSIF